MCLVGDEVQLKWIGMKLIFQEQENQLPKGNRKVNTSKVHFALKYTYTGFLGKEEPREGKRVFKPPF